MKFILPILLIFSLLLCSCSVDSLGGIISSITGNTKEPEHVIPEHGLPDGSELEEKPNEDPEENPSDTPNDDSADEKPGDDKDDNKEDDDDDDSNVEVVKKPLNETTIVNFGDSIFGTQSGTGTEVSAYLAKATNATIYNVGYGGCRMASYLKSDSSINEPWDAFSMYRLADAIVSGDFSYQEAGFSFGEKNYRDYFRTHLDNLKKLDFNKVDIITISYGTNDFTSSKNNPKAPEDNKYDVNTLEGALRYSIEKIKKAFPYIEIYVCTPIYRTWYDKNNNYSVVGDSTTYKNSFGYVLNDYVDMIKGVVAEYDDVFIIDTANLGFNARNRLQYFSTTDGTHPNEKGRKLLAEFIAKALKEEHP